MFLLGQGNSKYLNFLEEISNLHFGFWSGMVFVRLSLKRIFKELGILTYVPC